jgi:hypothetical protein
MMSRTSSSGSCGVDICGGVVAEPYRGVTAGAAIVLNIGKVNGAKRTRRLDDVDVDDGGVGR